MPKTKAITSFALGIFFWLPLFNLILAPLAVFFGIKAVNEMRQKKKFDRKYLVMAAIGIILGVLPLLFEAISILTP